jgi:hypothetical protein
MLKSALLATALTFAFVVPASAQATMDCTEASLTKLRADIDAMTDKQKQAEAMKSWEAAQTAFKANKLDECKEGADHAGKNMQGGDGAAPDTSNN